MIESIMKQYLDGEVIAEPITTGLINETYKIVSENNTFVLQRLNPIYTPEVVLDFDAVTRHLMANGFQAPLLVTTKSKKPFVVDEGRLWRLMSYVPGRVFFRIENHEFAYEAGKILGRFHLAIQKLDYIFQNPRPPAHRTEVIFEQFLRSVDGNNDRAVVALKAPILKIPNLLLRRSTRISVVHGDPKPNNIIFGETTMKAITLVDLDGCMRNRVLVELGDAFRSWCGSFEDDPENFFDLDKFKAALHGYLDGTESFTNLDELKLIPHATMLIILELASRFLKDYIEDKYFGWDSTRYPSRKDHNLARTRSQLRLFEDLREKTKLLLEIITDVLR